MCKALESVSQDRKKRQEGKSKAKRQEGRHEENW
jgi:hypothetical protein